MKKKKKTNDRAKEESRIRVEIKGKKRWKSGRRRKKKKKKVLLSSLQYPRWVFFLFCSRCLSVCLFVVARIEDKWTKFLSHLFSSLFFLSFLFFRGINLFSLFAESGKKEGRKEGRKGSKESTDNAAWAQREGRFYPWTKWWTTTE